MHPNTRAAFWISGSLLSFSAMAIAGRELGDMLPVAVILLVRGVAGVAFTGGIIAWTDSRSFRISLTDFRALLLRNVAHFGASYCWFLGVTLLPLAEVFAIEFTMPIWAALLAIAFLGERLNRLRTTGIAIGLAGALVILRPGTEVFSPASLIVLLAAIGFAVSLVATRRVIGGMPTMVFLFYMSLLQLPLGMAIAAMDWAPITIASVPWLAVTSAAAFFAHFCLARALRLAEASLVAPMDFLRLPLIAAVGAALYGETLDEWVAAGACLACLGNWLNLRGGERPQSRRRDRGSAKTPREPNRFS